MANKILVDPTLFPSIAAFYEKERGDLLQVKTYVTSNCTLGDAFGLLLSGLKPQYESARDKAEEVMQTIADTLDKLSTQVANYKADVEHNEASLQAQIDLLTARLDAIQNPNNPSAVSGGGGYAGGGGGGSYSGPSGSVTPTPSVPPPAQDETPTTINITAEPGSTVTVGNDDTVTTNPPVTAPDPTAVTPDPIATAPDPTATTPVPGTPDPTAVAAENAREAAFYDQFWKEQASVDPLGRTADALREAWESKEPIQLDPTLSGGLGYGAPDPLVAVPFDFSLISSTVPSTMVATSTAPVLIGAAQ
jgi:uncharacterized coiled-coil protein SlyX